MYWMLTKHKRIIIRNNHFNKMNLTFKNWVKNLQTAVYNGASTVNQLFYLLKFLWGFIGPQWRRIFKELPELFAESTGIPLSVIKNTWTLYQAGSRRLPVDPDKFAELANETAAQYRAAIPWYPLCASFHRMQKHWPEMMRRLPPTISLAMLSEVGSCIAKRFELRPFK